MNWWFCGTLDIFWHMIYPQESLNSSLFDILLLLFNGFTFHWKLEVRVIDWCIEWYGPLRPSPFFTSWPEWQWSGHWFWQWSWPWTWHLDNDPDNDLGSDYDLILTMFWQWSCQWCWPRLTPPWPCRCHWCPTAWGRWCGRRAAAVCCCRAPPAPHASAMRAQGQY